MFSDMDEIQREFAAYSQRPDEVFEALEMRRLAHLARNVGWYGWLSGAERKARVERKRAYRASKRVAKVPVAKVVKTKPPHYTVVTRAQRYGRKTRHLV